MLPRFDPTRPLDAAHRLGLPDTAVRATSSNRQGPLLGSGKTDYVAVTQLAANQLAIPPAERRRRNQRFPYWRLTNGEAEMYLLWVIIIGFLAGAIAKFFVGGPRGFIVTTLLGILGAIFASWLGQQIGWYGPGQRAGLVGAIVGAVLILAVYRAIVGGPQA